MVKKVKRDLIGHLKIRKTDHNKRLAPFFLTLGATQKKRRQAPTVSGKKKQQLLKQ